MMLRLFIGVITGLIMTSCGTSKSVRDLMNSSQYGIKKVHIENKNSSYDDLIADYNESMKSEDQKSLERMAKDTMLYMRKGPCLGHCPVYSITVYNSGRVKYEGVNFVDLKGIYESKLDEQQIAKAQELIRKVDLTRMYSRYPGTVDNVADVARTNLTISDGRLKFSTLISYGEPESIKDVQEYLKFLVKDLSWVQI